MPDSSDLSSLVDAGGRTLAFGDDDTDDLELGPLAFGCMRLAGADPATRQELIETALELDMNLIDTADIYGRGHGGAGFGDAEEVLGKMLTEAPELRDRMVLATKGGVRNGVPYDSSPTYLEQACDDSLRRLGVDVIDLYQVHRPDLFAHPLDVAETLDALVAAGKVRTIGVSNHTPAQTRALAAYLETPLVATQPEFSALHLDPLRDGSFDLAMEEGLAVLAFSPLASGRLGTGEGVRRELLAVLDELAARESVDRATLALAFVLCAPASPVAILGTLQPQRLRDAQRALTVHLDRTDCYRIIEASEGVALPVTQPAGSDPVTRRPNVVLINCDDLGYGDLGCYGSPVNQTPAIDALAAAGIRFDSFYMASPVCSPSRAAMLTGCYPPRIGFGSLDGIPVLFPGQDLGLPASEVTIADVLRSAGYRTQMIGKWHCGDQPGFLPTDHGFDHYFGLPYSNDMGRQVPMEEPAPGAAPHYLPPLPLMEDGEVIEQQPDQAALTERYVTEAVRFLRDVGDEPFFLYLAHLYVHVPIFVQERFARQSANGSYGAAVEAIDWSTAAIVHELEQLRLRDDTIVIFTSDNGSRGVDGGSNQPLRGAKTTTWEGGMRVPFVASWPGRIPAGQVTSEVATAMDLLPTLANLCAAELPGDRAIDGRDIVPLLLEPGAASPHEVFLYYWMDDLEAVRVGRWKLHLAKHGTKQVELYDLEADPSEATDLASALPDVIADLQVHVERARATLGDALEGRPAVEARPIGRAAHPVPLTTYDPDHPYYLAEYDLADRG